MVVGRLLSYREGNFSGAMLNFGGVYRTGSHDVVGQRHLGKQLPNSQEMSLRSLPFANLKWGSSAVRAISKTLGERGIPLTSNQIQCLVLALLWISVPFDSKPRVYQWKGQDHDGIRPKVFFFVVPHVIWCAVLAEWVLEKLPCSHSMQTTLAERLRYSLLYRYPELHLACMQLPTCSSHIFAFLILTDMLHFLCNKKQNCWQESLHFCPKPSIHWGTAWKKRVMSWASRFWLTARWHWVFCPSLEK